jgi:predicted alpha/beta superfamily hydrolase
MESTEIKLLEALERIKQGNPIHISKEKKLSFSSVEDEALVSRSLSRHYPETFQKIKNEIELNKAKKIVLNNSKESPQAKNLKEENEILKEQIRLLKKEKEELLVANISLAERVRFLNQKIK